jgi:hypothetical protein
MKQNVKNDRGNEGVVRGSRRVRTKESVGEWWKRRKTMRIGKGEMLSIITHSPLNDCSIDPLPIVKVAHKHEKCSEITV